jgi:RluA family pseudouridine synthase
VLDKPAGIVVHPDAQGSPDLISACTQMLKDDAKLSHAVAWDGQCEPSVAHRLDRNVSGIVLISVDARVRPLLQQQFQDKTVRKTYRAIVHGQPQDKQGLWRKTMTKKAEGKSNPAGYAKRRVPAETEYRVMHQNEDHSLLELNPISGRKHQLRRHCALAKCPIVGDDRYGEDVGNLGRILLHAHQLTFSDPWSGETLDVTAAPPFTLED